MATVTLTPRGIAALKPGVEAWDTVVPGLHVRAGTTRTTYHLRYRANGSQRRYKLGAHPVLTLVKARERAREVLGDVARGDDPSTDRTESRSADATFRALVAEVLEAKKRETRPRTQQLRQRIVDNELLPVWGARLASSITRRDIKLLVEKVAARGAPVWANRTLSTISMLFNEAVEREFAGIENNPAYRVRPPGQEGSRDRYLSRKELKALWKALDEESATIRGFVKLVFLTAQRGHSVAAMRWADADAATGCWTIPATSFKGKRDHLVPLSTEALDVLEELRPVQEEEDDDPSEHVFPGRGDGKTPHLNSWNPAMRRIRKRMGAAFWLHDSRTTFRTWATRPVAPADARDPAGCGVLPHIADLCLGHADPSLGTRRYQGDKLTFLLPERRQALEAWGRFVRVAVGGAG